MSFFAMSLAIAGWNFAYLFYNDPVLFNQLFWIKAIYLIGAVIVSGVFLFSFAFPTNKTPPQLLLAVSSVLMTALALATIFSDRIIASVETTGSGPEVKVGDLYVALVAVWSALAFLAIFNLVRSYFRSSGVVKMQFVYIFVGIAILTLSALVFDAFFPVVVGTSQYFPLSAASSIFFVGLTAYAIITHRLFDIRLLIARSLAYSLLITTMAGLYSLGIFGISNLLFSDQFGSTGQQTVTYAALAVLLAFTFQPLKDTFTRLTDQIFFKDHYDSQALLQNLSRMMAINFELDPLLDSILKELVETMRLSSGSFVLMEEEKIYAVKEYGFSNPPRYPIEQIKRLSGERKTLILDEMPEGEVKEMLHGLSAAIAAPIVAEQKFIGFLFLGDKKTGEILTDQDLQITKILAPEISVAIANAQAVDKIQRFNIILKNEVEDATAQLRQANEELTALDERKDEFFSIATHELRTPLTAIRGNAALLDEMYTSKILEKDFKEMISAIEVSSDRLVGIINEYLNMSRLEQGRMQFNTTSFQMRNTVAEVLKDLEAAATEKKLYLKVESSSAEVVTVSADRDKVKEILINLIGNAMKFTKIGGITISFQEIPGAVKILVQDTGQGIPGDRQNLLFRKYQQAGSKKLVKQEGSGTGLGLYISKLMAEGMGGQVKLENSVEGQGSTFAFTLPTQPVSTQPKPVETANS